MNRLKKMLREGDRAHAKQVDKLVRRLDRLQDLLDAFPLRQELAPTTGIEQTNIENEEEARTFGASSIPEGGLDQQMESMTVEGSPIPEASEAKAPESGEAKTTTP